MNKKLLKNIKSILSTGLIVSTGFLTLSAHALTVKNVAQSGYWGDTLLPDPGQINSIKINGVDKNFSQSINEIYNRFVGNYIVDAGNGRARVKWGSGGALRVGTDNNNVSKDAYATASEGMGYGMLITAYGGDKTRFDKLTKFYLHVMDQNPSAQLMPWLVWNNGTPVTNNVCYQTSSGQTCTPAGGDGPATDGDIDIAMALLVASHQWGNKGTINYKAEAIQIINELHDNWMHYCNNSGVWVVKPYETANFNACSSEIDPSYSIPAFFRVFAQINNIKNDNDRWNSAARDAYKLFDLTKAGTNSNKTFVPDWLKVNGNAITTGRSINYGSDASRIPWRVAMDYAWFGTTDAKNWSRRLVNDLIDNSNNGSIADINSDIQPATGNSSTAYNGRSFSGGFTTAAMMYDWWPDNINNYTNHWLEETINGSIPWSIGPNGYENSNNDYYGMALSTLYALTLSGNTYKPNPNKAEPNSQ